MKIRMSEYEQPEQKEQTEAKEEQTEQKTALDLSLDGLLDW
jgi:hypothetical protein